jgi:hypothetical protein
MLSNFTTNYNSSVVAIFYFAMRAKLQHKKESLGNGKLKGLTVSLARSRQIQIHLQQISVDVSL